MNVNRKNDSMKKILVWGLLAVLGIACYDDLGNYDYNDGRRTALCSGK